MKDLILLHGALGADTLFEQLVKQLPETYQVYTFNLSGHGKTPFSNIGFGMEVFAEELAHFIQVNKLVKPLIFGYSMGGYVALHLEALQPNTFDSIITLGTKFEWNPEAAEKEASRLKPEIIEQKVPVFANMLATRHGDQWKALLEATATMMKALGQEPLLTKTCLSPIRIPVTIMRGDRDNMVSREESENAASYIPNASFKELQATPHPLEKVDPIMLAGCIKACQ